LDELIEQAEYLQFEEDKAQRDNLNGIHLLENEFRGQLLKIIIRETQDKTYFYDHSTKKQNS